jgi:hypothetical protein
MYQTSNNKDENKSNKGKQMKRSEQDGKISRQVTQSYKPTYNVVTKTENRSTTTRLRF